MKRKKHKSLTRLSEKTKLKAKFVRATQVTGGSYEEAMHNVVISVKGIHFWIPSVHGKVIDRLEKEKRLIDLLSLSGMKRLTYVPYEKWRKLKIPIPYV